MVLEAIENDLRGRKAEELVLVSKRHMEHVMPQQWATHWPLPSTASPMAGAQRDMARHRLGNVTLTT